MKPKKPIYKKGWFVGVAIFVVLVMISIPVVGFGQNVHENISEEIAADTKQILSIFDETIDDQRALTEREQKSFEQYSLKYSVKSDAAELSEEEDRLYILTYKMIEMYDYYTALTSDQSDYEKMKQMIERVIETGEI